MINAANTQQRVRDTLVGFPPEVTAAYVGFAETGAQQNLDIVVLGVLQFYLAKKPKTSLHALPGSTRLVEDLGCDSLTMMDMVFAAESLFDINIDDNDLASIATLNDLRGHIHRLVIGNASRAA
jgi:acyl carrier protein